jgi:hypothetical protein
MRGRRGAVLDLDTRLAEGRVEDLLPFVVTVGEERVDVLLQHGVILRDAHAVALLREEAGVVALGVGQNLQLVGALSRVADEDGRVGRDRVDLAAQEVLHALRVDVVLLRLHLGEVLGDVLDRRRSRRRAHGLAVEGRLVLHLGDRAVGGDEEPLTGDEVRAREGDLLLALVRDRVGADVVVDVAAHELLLAVRGSDGLVGDVVLREAERCGDPSGDLDVEAAALAGRDVEVAEARLVLLHTDDRAAVLDHLVVGRAALEDDVLSDLGLRGRVPTV